MTDTTEREPRVTPARKRIKPMPSWMLIFESYTPMETPWPDMAVPVILLGQGLIWAEGGTPDSGVLCQIMHQTNTGSAPEVDMSSDDAWDMLVSSLSALAWNDLASKETAYTAAAYMLADNERKAINAQQVSEMIVETANDVLARLGMINTEVDPDVQAEEPEPTVEPQEDS